MNIKLYLCKQNMEVPSALKKRQILTFWRHRRVTHILWAAYLCVNVGVWRYL